MSEPILQSLISASAGLIGALIGFGGSLIVSLRAGKIARDQVRYARAHERRDEVLATLYGLVYEVEDDFDDVLRALRRLKDSGHTPEQERSSWAVLVNEAVRLNKELGNTVESLLSYHQKHFVWMPENISTTLIAILEPLVEQREKMISAVEDLLQRGRMVPDSVLDDSEDWLRNQYGEHAITLRDQIREVLGVEET